MRRVGWGLWPEVEVKAAPGGGSLQMRSLWFPNEYRKDLRADTKNWNQGYLWGKSLFHQENKVQDEETLWFKRS